MGLFVVCIADGAHIAPEKLEDAYRRACGLNSRDDLMGGGRYTASGIAHDPKPEGSRSAASSPNKWFSFMPWDYDEKCKDIKEVLECVGYDVRDAADGGLDIIGFFDMIGQEDLFLSAIAPCLDPSAHFDWAREDGYRWENTVAADGTLQENYPIELLLDSYGGRRPGEEAFDSMCQEYVTMAQKLDAGVPAAEPEAEQGQDAGEPVARRRSARRTRSSSLTQASGGVTMAL